jgi:hypothetical protein
VLGFTYPAVWRIDNISDEHGWVIEVVTLQERKIELVEAHRNWWK